MWRFINSPQRLALTSMFAILALYFMGDGWTWAAENPSRIKPTFVKPIPDLFVHKSHLEAFRQSGIACADCHSFSIKTNTSDPTSSGVGEGYLRVDRSVCHQCHLGKVNVPRSNQCILCHRDPQFLAPASHHRNWRQRHGQQALQDPDSCLACHNQKTCSECHSQRNPSKPIVHRANFRLTHSIEARANPQSCATCHASLNTCIQCHTKGLFP